MQFFSHGKKRHHILSGCSSLLRSKAQINLHLTPFTPSTPLCCIMTPQTGETLKSLPPKMIATFVLKNMELQVFWSYEKCSAKGLGQCSPSIPSTLRHRWNGHPPPLCPTSDRDAMDECKSYMLESFLLSYGN